MSIASPNNVEYCIPVCFFTQSKNNMSKMFVYPLLQIIQFNAYSVLFNSMVYVRILEQIVINIFHKQLRSWWRSSLMHKICQIDVIHIQYVCGLELFVELLHLIHKLQKAFTELAQVLSLSNLNYTSSNKTLSADNPLRGHLSLTVTFFVLIWEELDHIKLKQISS